ncbi:MAG: glycosyltransferase family 2 protein, partial [Pirellulaceae bacterium]
MSFLNEVLFWLAAIDLALCVVVGLQLFHAGRRLKRLGDVEWSGVVKLPSISVIVAARNEERHIELALRSLLALDYPGLEIVVVDDRSTDRTGEILDRMANSLAAPGLSSTALRVVHLQDLPPGWIGKNHALYCGAREATGEWILFTDADIVM